MVTKCVYCGGMCEDKGGGFYECRYCGSTFMGEASTNASAEAKPASSAGVGGADVFEQNINGILEISCMGKDGMWSGSGYLISASGYAITNAHVAAEEGSGKPCQKIAVRLCNRVVAATVVALADNKAGAGNGIDLALIKLAALPSGATPLKFEDSDKLRNGEPVFVIGNSLGQGTCITSGIISDKSRDINGKKFIMTDCAVNGGNSGGPIFNHSGLVIGTITLQGRTHTGSDAEGMNYAIPANVVKKFIAQNNILL